MKLLDYLLEHELVSDERAARGLIMRGDVLVNDKPVTSAAADVGSGSAVRLRKDSAKTDVSRGAGKLRPVVARLHFACAGQVALDLGAAHGGFTQVLLESGARTVFAVDVAYGMLALELRNDPRVVLLERTNARALTRRQVPEPPDIVVGDLSFISWSAVLPAIVPLLAEQAELLLLVKPQFELAAAGQSELLQGGVTDDRAVQRDCLAGLYNTWCQHGLAPQAVVPAGVRGAKGNQEFFVYLIPGQAGQEAYERMIEQALAEVAT